jgi:HSP20 family molecular chaperone IbpA
MAENEDSNNTIGYTAEETPEELRVHIEVADPETALIDVDENEIKVLVPREGEDVEEGEMLLGEIPLPQGVDTDSMEASIEDGHLDIILRKQAEI